MTTKDEKLLILLDAEWQLLESSIQTLLQSVEKCKAIGIKPDYTFEELESFDSLSSKFNRSSDLFTQKFIRTVWMLLHESFIPFIDLMNSTEKSGILCSANQMIAIRDMRNQIAHEYIPEAIVDLIPEVIDMIQQLIDNINCCKNFLIHREWLKE